MDTTSLPRLGTYTDRLQREKAAAVFLDHAITLATDRALGVTGKATVPALSQANTSSLQDAGVAFAALVARESLIGKMAGAWVPAPPYTRVAAVDDLGIGGFVGEGLPVPVARLSFGGPVMAPARISTIVGLSNELLRVAPTARPLIESVVTRSLRLTEDRLLLDAEAAVDNVRPSGLLYNVTPAGSGSPESLIDDITALVASVRAGEADKAFFITSSRGAAYLSMARDGLTTLFPGVGLNGGTLLGTPLLTSRAAGANLILLDAGQLAVSDGTLEVFTSESAAVEMSDSPSMPAALVSAFQTNSVFLRFTRFLSWALASDDAVGYVTLPIGGSPA